MTLSFGGFSFGPNGTASHCSVVLALVCSGMVRFLICSFRFQQEGGADRDVKVRGGQDRASDVRCERASMQTSPAHRLGSRPWSSRGDVRGT